MASYGCYCCRFHGIANSHVLIHHCEGRTKPNAHMMILPLCDAHHSPYIVGGLHENKTRWQRTYGTELGCVRTLFDYFEQPYIEELK